ncbi:hypothetical protein DESC_370068 [Desulfosarcina cetonica]|nr:hypothetical protein DESC_370068 [Desulfosarcina cetonica]
MDAFAQRGEQHHGANAHGNAQNREKAAQALADQGVQGPNDGVTKGHGGVGALVY